MPNSIEPPEYDFAIKLDALTSKDTDSHLRDLPLDPACAVVPANDEHGIVDAVP